MCTPSVRGKSETNLDRVPIERLCIRVFQALVREELTDSPLPDCVSFLLSRSPCPGTSHKTEPKEHTDGARTASHGQESVCARGRPYYDRPTHRALRSSVRPVRADVRITRKCQVLLGGTHRAASSAEGLGGSRTPSPRLARWPRSAPPEVDGSIILRSDSETSNSAARPFRQYSLAKGAPFLLNVGLDLVHACSAAKTDA